MDAFIHAALNYAGCLLRLYDYAYAIQCYGYLVNNTLHNRITAQIRKSGAVSLIKLAHRKQWNEFSYQWSFDRLGFDCISLDCFALAKIIIDVQSR